MPPANLVENNSMGTTRAHKPLTGQKVVRKKKALTNYTCLYIYRHALEENCAIYLHIDPRYYLNPVFVIVVTFIDIISSIEMYAS